MIEGCKKMVDCSLYHLEPMDDVLCGKQVMIAGYCREHVAERCRQKLACCAVSIWNRICLLLGEA